jgi:hypothetical protein
LDGLDLVEQIGVAQKTIGDLGVVENELVILGGDSGIDGDINATGRKDALVADVPLRAVVRGNDGYFIARLHPKSDQAEG